MAKLSELVDEHRELLKYIFSVLDSMLIAVLWTALFVYATFSTADSDIVALTWLSAATLFLLLFYVDMKS